METIIFSKTQIKRLDNLAIRFQNKNLLSCNDDSKKSMIRLFKINKINQPLALLMQAHLTSWGLDCRIENNYLIVRNSSCLEVNQITRHFFQTMVEVKAAA